MTAFDLRLFVALAFVVGAVSAAPASEPVAPSLRTPSAVTDPSYHLSPGDTVGITVYNEPDLAINQTLGRAGEARAYLIGEITLGGRTVREAEVALERIYRERELLKNPVVTLTVIAYFPREVSVLGAVRTPGTVVFPRDTTSLDIVEVITRVGGFLPISKAEAVTISRRLPDGNEKILTVDLDSVISGRRRAGRDRADFSIYPGDRIWVPERLF
ncbi:MAG: polysaccharide biosynthesis/export family protein [Undibacterium sp.]|nr:polysaccharide biosynthesis/export family protein [Opitutaceae bacterium]